MKKVRKAVIPAAGLGTRFLPATKALAKEMLPIVDKPTIQYIVKEALAAEIEEILIVDGKSKRSIEDHFDANPELEQALAADGKLEKLALVEETTNIPMYFIRQSKPRGLGDAVLQAKAFVGDEPFVVLLGDDMMRDTVPLTKQLINQYEKTGESTLAVVRVPHEETAKYGVIDPVKELGDNLYQVHQFVEKPNPADAPSDLAIVGRYLLTPEIFEELEQTQPGKGGEIQLTDAIDSLNKRQHVYAHEFTGKRYDIGSKIGFLTTSIEFGLEHPETKDELRTYLMQLATTL